MRLPKVYGAVRLDNGNEINLDGSYCNLGALADSISSGAKIKTLDPDGNLGEEAHWCVNMGLFQLIIDNANDAMKFIKQIYS